MATATPVDITPAPVLAFAAAHPSVSNVRVPDESLNRPVEVTASAIQPQINISTLAGPLEGPKLAAEVRAKPSAGRPEQSLSARAGLRPFAAWPLAELQASTKALDLSAFHASAPLTALSGEASATTAGIDQPATVDARFSNAAAGRWNEGRLPLRELTLALRDVKVSMRAALTLEVISIVAITAVLVATVFKHGIADKAQF